MATPKIQVADIGTLIRVTVLSNDLVPVAVDISTATLIQIIFKRPDGALLTTTAFFITDGTDGKIGYSTAAGDINEAGIWRLQGYIEMPAGKWYTSVGKFKAVANL